MKEFCQMLFKEIMQIPYRDLIRRFEKLNLSLPALFAFLILMSCHQKENDLKEILKATDTVKISQYHKYDTSFYFVAGQKDLGIFTNAINGKQENLPFDTLICRIQYYSKGHMVLDASLFKGGIQYHHENVLYRERITYQAGMYLDQLLSSFASTNDFKDPLSLLKRVHIVDDISGVTISGNFPDNWIRSSDVETLIGLFKSKAKCACLVDPISSYIPFDSVAEVGGYAIQWIKAFKGKKKYSFSQYTCPKVNIKEADSLIRWWLQETSKKLK